jgi:hypothetical protein
MLRSGDGLLTSKNYRDLDPQVPRELATLQCDIGSFRLGPGRTSGTCRQRQFSGTSGLDLIVVSVPQAIYPASARAAIDATLAAAG